MTADEELRRTGIETASDAGVVVTGIAADVLHEHFDALALESVFLAEHVAEVATVDVASSAISTVPMSPACQISSHSLKYFW